MNISRQDTRPNPSLSRDAERRVDTAWLSQAWENPAARVVLFDGDQVAVDTDGAALAAPAAEFAARRDFCNWVLLGNREGTPWFAMDIGPQPERRFDALRPLLAAAGPEQTELLATARSLLHWHATHRFCGACGAPTIALRGGYERQCPDCGRQLFPRTDPAVIVRVTHDDRCLLGRQRNWPQGRFSVIAGFVEPGETLEAAVRREVAEETGVALARVDYLASQAWPFPQSIMLGFTAEGASTELTLPDGELVEAHWFSRDELAGGLAAGELFVSKPYSIAHRLIAEWFDPGQPTPLAELATRW